MSLQAVSGSRRVARLRARNKVQAEAKATASTRAVIYTRVSTDEQVTGHGLEAQERAVRAFAESQSYEVVGIVSDPGVSGAVRPADRPGFATILQMAEARSFEILLVAKIDRLSRDVRHALMTVSDLAELHGVAFRSVTEAVIDTSNSIGRMFFTFFAGMAEQERYLIRDRTAGGRTTKARKGGFAGGQAPYGYERDLEGGLRIVPAQAKVVRRIFEARKRKTTLKAIAEALNADGIPAPKGGRWSISTVAYVTDNMKYRGAIEYLFRWNGQETHVLADGDHEAIVKSP
ncbi:MULTISPECIES: recombinase family protein [Methylobacterium]|uniref:DNA invertase Pin-like site-specific DNA recombinase n=2 Tax=Methylobacterium radiotolerans TaxID=31998 RepID=A0ABV2NPA3_9HYPH|nr:MULTISPECIES: recombinase family protein [unclassified Methylobacterium]MBP2494696.1 DNA invertase Pin-like site-specific DNA recombinase [Methylobacterium sp. PvP105]MBP2494955.1 DNA invertase Pin-like site-specific DNA recombinase [Methylobacterium sp. PvP105]MBP2505174.1 DNA invertase Pin-like site-specific DNA recombinase [Methylobacterium sp. PvP109]MBP2505433.1 DNA invertase Pin-like site-specific DNA recombinase [Methylobacterium sp. PvP109]